MRMAARETHAMLRSPPRTPLAVALCIAGAVLYFLSFLNFHLYALTWICFVPVLFAIRDATPKRALWLGTIFGAVTNGGGFYWITHLIEEFGHLHISLAIAGFVLLCIYQGFLLAIVLACVRRAERDLHIAPVWSLAIVFPALEVVYPLLFPSYIGNSQFEFSAITQFVDITGMAGLTVLLGLVNGALYEILDARVASRKIERLRLIVPACAFLLCAGYGLVRLPAIDAKTQAAPRLNVGLIQTNIGAGDKAKDPEEFVARHQQMSKALVATHPEVELIVWPESAYNRLIERSQKNVDYDVTSGIGRPLLFGVLTYSQGATREDSQIFNSLLLASATGDVLGIYDKIELLAFGETYPFSRTFPSLTAVFGTSWFTRGTSLQHLQLADASLLPMICYEDILPSLVLDIWHHDGPSDVLVNITNDSWYGDTHQPMIHLVLASFRSIETRRALIRSTNTGISAIVDPAGRITQRTGQWKRETLVAAVPLIKDGSQTVFMRLGNVIGWLCVALTAVGCWRCWRVKKRSA
jgi:apolipoprotein N-acyltransferase